MILLECYSPVSPRHAGVSFATASPAESVLFKREPKNCIRNRYDRPGNPRQMDCAQAPDFQRREHFTHSTNQAVAGRAGRSGWAELALGIGGFGIGTGEFVMMGLLSTESRSAWANASFEICDAPIFEVSLPPDTATETLPSLLCTALRLGELKDSALTAGKLGESDRIIVAGSSYLAQRGVPYTPDDLLAHDGIVYAPGTGGDEWRFRQGTSEISIRIQSRLVITAAEGVRAAVIAGLGLTAASRWMFAPELASGLVRQVLSDWMLPPAPVWSVYPPLAGWQVPRRANSYSGFSVSWRS